MSSPEKPSVRGGQIQSIEKPISTVLFWVTHIIDCLGKSMLYIRLSLFSSPGRTC